MRRLFGMIAALALWVGAVAPGMAQLSPDWTQCVGGPSVSFDQQIAGCTRIIDSGTEGSEGLTVAFYNRGVAYHAEQEIARAIQDYDEAIRINPNYALAFNNRGNAYADKGGFTRAIEDYDQAIRLRPDDPDAYYNRGNMHRLMGDMNRAIQDYDQAISLKPDHVFALTNRGIAYGAKGDFSRAIESYDTAIRFEPGDAFALNNRGVTFMDKGDFARAIADFDQAIRLNPDFALAYANRGRAYLKLEQIERAIADLEKGVALDPNLGDWAKSALAEARAAQKALASRAIAAARRIAMIIGNGQYPYIGTLKNAENDAVKIAAALQAKGYEIMGPNGTAAPFTNLTKSQMEAALDAFQGQAVTAEVALIWYAGHGSSFQIADQQKDNFLLPIDFRSKDAKDILVKGVSVERMKRAVIPSSRLRVLIIDACRDNNVQVTTRGLKRGLLPEGRNNDMVIMFSTKAGEQAEDGDGELSPFAEGFLEELSANPKNTILNFLTAVSGRVKAKTDPDQIPEIFTNVTDPKLTLVK
ncbi:MAG TPA: hypothetical protein DCL54_01820 [Alphaproteobacteria bacterium]|nr:hypothetical protein [Alphaproteobacteria bacterium]HAJ45304.1 hypothetical protein [Alphaproteobacteria bacterium]